MRTAKDVTQKYGEATYDFEQRDPQYIRDTLSSLWLYASVWHRAEVRGLERVPDGPVLFVGNHSGGVTPPDAPVFAVAFYTWFGADRPVFLLTHDVMFGIPVIGNFLKKWGMMPASRANTAHALARGASVMVFPGGDHEVYRPSSDSAVIDFGGRKGFIDLALEAGVPIVPVVQIGGQETALFLSRGEGLARAFRIDKLLRAKVFPIAFGPPFGISFGQPTLPLPAKITCQVLDPIDLTKRFGDDPDRQAVYDHVTGVMQQALTSLADERRFPVIG